MDIQAYLARMNYDGPTGPDAETLRGLQVAHLQSVPFENLSIHAGEPIVLTDEALFTKIVERRRGGFCYEANGLFAALLRALGFETRMLSAEVAHAEGGFSEPFDHMALMVGLEERWLVDVGFGDSFMEPLRLDETSQQLQGQLQGQIQGGRVYRISVDGDYRILERCEGSQWKPEYRFTLQPYIYGDFSGMCEYHQTSRESHFTQKRICSRATADGGRITLSDMRLIETAGDGKRNERMLATQDEYDTVLGESFGIVM